MTLSPIWQFWEGDADPPDHISFCMATVQAHHPGRVRLLRSVPVECYETMGQLHPDTRIQQRSDVLRAFLLWKYGGFWLDTDFMAFRSIDEVLPADGSAHFAAYRRPDYDGYDVDFMWARRWSWVTEIYRDMIRSYLERRRGTVAAWGDVGAGILTRIFHEYGMAGVAEVSADKVSPLRRAAFALDLPLPEEEASYDVFPEACGMMLVNSVSGEYLRGKSMHEILSSKTVIGHMCRVALRRLPR